VNSQRPATPVFLAFGALSLLAAGEAAHGLAGANDATERIAAEAQIVRSLGLSDLALFTEARYTRHPALADLASAFQDNPLSFDHFPSGSLIAPPDYTGQTGLGFAAEEVAR